MFAFLGKDCFGFAYVHLDKLSYPESLYILQTLNLSIEDGRGSTVEGYATCKYSRGNQVFMCSSPCRFVCSLDCLK